ncbi:MAG TPA: 3-deoxy-7-phosphoheptulonate synthase [Geothrix sp.]|nr:3-deoxy-7-phosphoheptulonate synthase [Geothrix sp.]
MSLETPPETTAPLEAARATIDQADRELIRLLARRFEAVRQVAQVKQSSADLTVLDPGRELSVQDNWLRDAETLGLPAPFARRMLKEILNQSRRLQEPILGSGDAPAEQTLRVGYQGILGSYSALSAAHLMATRTQAKTELIGFSTFPQVVEALQGGALDYAFLPVENSLMGSILDVNRLICDQALSIVDEDTWVVDHVLAALPGVQLEDLRSIRSHPAALAQCETFLREMEMDRVERMPWFDTAGAARSLAETQCRDAAALCSEEAATRYGLEVLARDIADRERNVTRFLLLAQEPEASDPRVPSKTSLLLRLNHHEGSLVRMLSAFSEGHINLTRIESRPLLDSPWEYLFFVDIEGHQATPEVKKALQKARQACNHMRILGSYPCRTRPDKHLEEAPPPGPSPVIEQVQAASGPPEPARHARVQVGNASIGEGTFTLIAGPCAVESRDQILDAARLVRSAGCPILRGGAFKPRSSPYDFQGLGLEGLRYLQEAGQLSGLPVVTEVITIEDIAAVVAHADMLQVGARNMHNFALLRELGKLDKPILLKRGMSATIKEFLMAAEYILAGGNQQVVLCERGIRTFETSTRSTLDVSAVPVLKRATHLPVIVDPSHAAGNRELVIPLALAAAAAGADGLIVEVHPRPEEALCDKTQALRPDDLEGMVASLRPIVASLGRRWL